MRRCMVLLAVCLFVFAGQSNVVGDVLYDVVDLTAGSNTVIAESLNDSGQVVGRIKDPATGIWNAILFDTTGNGQHVSLGTLGGGRGRAIDINENGVIVGWALPPDNTHHVTIFDSSGAGNNTDLGRNGYAVADASAINDLGQIVGNGYHSSDDYFAGISNAVLFDETGNGNNIYLGTLGGATGSAGDINNAGVIIGLALNGNGYRRAVVYDATGGGNNFDLGTLGGMISAARDINEAGQIIGVAGDVNGNNHATLFGSYYSRNNIDLGTLGGDNSKALAINELGEIVGWALDADGNKQAAMFDPTGAGANLNLNDLIDDSLDIDLTVASDINNYGQIICHGFDSAGNSHVYLLSVIPEPCSLLLLGLGGLLLRRRT